MRSEGEPIPSKPGTRPSRSWPLRLCACLLLLCLGAAAQAAEQIRFALGQAWAPPFSLVQDGELRGGLLYELMEQIAREAKAEAVYIPLPPRRVDAALAEGKIDMHCFVSPRWFAKVPPAARWSLPLLALDDVLLAGPTFAGPLKNGQVDLEAARQLSLGVVVDYHYPSLAPWLAKGHLQADEAPTQESVLEKLLRGRTALAVANRYTAVAFNKSLPADKQLRMLQTVDSVNTHCLLAERTQLSAERLLGAVNRVAKSAAWRDTQARYR